MATDELDAIRDAWDKHTGGGRQEDETRSLCDAYVAAHPEQFTALREMGLEACVQAIDVLRDDPDNAFAPMLRFMLGIDDWYLVQVWLWHHFEPQIIGGTAEPKIRMVNGG
jgi:hypothetical protein